MSATHDTFAHVGLTTNTLSLPLSFLGPDDSRTYAFTLQEIGDSHILLLLEQSHALNWAAASALFPLRTLGDGNCLLHSVALAMWGVCDSPPLGIMRQAIAATLAAPRPGEMVRERWEMELRNADQALPDAFRAARDWEREWLAVAALPTLTKDSVRDDGRMLGAGGASLLNIHVFVLAQLLRRPIVVYTSDGAEVETGESMSGIYLPSLCAPDSCFHQPLTLAYTPGHFTALVPVMGKTTHVPLCNEQGVPLVVRFEDPHLPREAVLSPYLKLVHHFPAGVKESAFLPQVGECLPETTVLVDQYFSAAAARLSEQPEFLT